jgi:hypothetical protein
VIGVVSVGSGRMQRSTRLLRCSGPINRTSNGSATVSYTEKTVFSVAAHSSSHRQRSVGRRTNRHILKMALQAVRGAIFGGKQ